MGAKVTALKNNHHLNFSITNDSNKHWNQLHINLELITER